MAFDLDPIFGKTWDAQLPLFRRPVVEWLTRGTAVGCSPRMSLGLIRERTGENSRRAFGFGCGALGTSNGIWGCPAALCALCRGAIMTALDAGAGGPLTLEGGFAAPVGAPRTIAHKPELTLVPRIEPALEHRRQWERRYARRVFVTDLAIVLGVASVTATAAAVTTGGTPAGAALLTVATAAIWLGMLSLGQTRVSEVMGSGATEYKRVAHATGFAFGVLAILFVVFQWQALRVELLVALPVGMLALLVARWGWRRWLRAPAPRRPLHLARDRDRHPRRHRVRHPHARRGRQLGLPRGRHGTSTATHGVASTAAPTPRRPDRIRRRARPAARRRHRSSSRAAPRTTPTSSSGSAGSSRAPPPSSSCRAGSPMSRARASRCARSTGSRSSTSRSPSSRAASTCSSARSTSSSRRSRSIPIALVTPVDRAAHHARLTRAGLLPPDARRPRRPRVRDAQVPHDARSTPRPSSPRSARRTRAPGRSSS